MQNINNQPKSEKRAFYKMVFALLLPIVGQNLIDALVTSTDVIILGFVHQRALSAVSLAGNIQFVFSLFLFGLVTGASMLSAQYWGKGDVRAIEKVLGIALRFSLSVGAVFFVAALFFPRLLMQIFTPDPALIEEGIIYLRIVAPTYLISAFTVMYLGTLRSMENVVLPMVTFAVTFVVNLSLDVVLIFVYHMGTAGVATTTLVARIIELVICIAYALKDTRFKPRIRDLFARNKILLHDFLRYAMPAIGNDIAFGLGFTMYSVIIGHLSSDAVAAYSIVAVARKLGTVLCFGVSSATAIIVGKALGADRMDDAKLYASRMLKLSVHAALVGGALILCMIPVLMRIGQLTDLARHYLWIMLLINAYYVMGQSVNTTLICGIFRAGGDSRFGLICDTIDLWVVMLPISALCAFVFKLPVMWVYFIMCMDEFVKMPFIVRHYHKFGWLKNITNVAA